MCQYNIMHTLQLNVVIRQCANNTPMIRCISSIYDFGVIGIVAKLGKYSV